MSFQDDSSGVSASSTHVGSCSSAIMSDDDLVQIKHGEEGNVGLKKDVSNLIAMDGRKLLGVDVERTLLHFRRKQEDDPEFFYAVDLDEDGSVKHIIWADGRSRRMYLEFGDVVTFDTTYNNNKYGMPLAPFIGVNHHRQSIFFGMTLLRSENTENFCWLFKTWLTAMYGKHPMAIITDQNPTISAAIKIVFPNAVHRCCQWHMMRKARENLGPLYRKIPGFQDELGSVINSSLTVSEFENAWAAMLDRYKLNCNKHLETMFEKRAEWVPAYFRNFFFAEMSTIQRGERMGALFKMWITSHTSIYKFVLKIDSMVESIWKKEGDEDMKTMIETPRTWSYYLLELDARRVYTRNVYSVFKKLLRDSTLGVVIEKERDALYEVKTDSHPEIDNWVPDSYLVKVDRNIDVFSCNCKGFEFEGLLCYHALKVMCQLQIQQLPSRYILKRWCKNVNAAENVGNSQASQMYSLAILNHLVKSASKDVHASTILEAKMREFLSQIMPLVSENSSQKAVLPTAASEDQAPFKSLVSHDPPQSQCKGRKKRPAHQKSAAEKAPIKRNTCSYCGKKEAHNIRTCPKLLTETASGEKKKDTANKRRRE